MCFKVLDTSNFLKVLSVESFAILPKTSHALSIFTADEEETSCIDDTVQVDCNMSAYHNFAWAWDHHCNDNTRKDEFRKRLHASSKFPPRQQWKIERAWLVLGRMAKINRKNLQEIASVEDFEAHC